VSKIVLALNSPKTALFKTEIIGAESNQQVMSYVVIGGGLTLNDTGFILVQTTCPTSNLSRSVTLFLNPGARSLQWGYK